MYVKCFKLLIMCVVIVKTIGNDYCEVKQCPGTHTMCQYPDRVACPGKKVKSGLTQEQRRRILHLHNVLRQKVALGRVPNMPPASNMMKMRWNNEAELIAQRWADQCKVARDVCRVLLSGRSAGQTVCGGNLSYKEGANRTHMMDKCFNFWYAEVNDIARASDVIKTFPGEKDLNDSIDSYTQLVSAMSSELGCGYLEQVPPNAWYQPVILICNYVPAGNIEGESVYLQGKPCSKCPQGTACSTMLPGLCADGKYEYNDFPNTGGALTVFPASLLISLCFVSSVLMLYLTLS